MIRPAYWTDDDLHTRLTAEQREFYIGLWMLADDAGYVVWDPARIGAELYPFRTAGWRRAHIEKWAETLVPHVQLLDCGRHLVVPTLPKHNAPPKPSYQNKRAHDTCLSLATWHQGAPSGDTSTVREEGSKGREGKGIRKGAPDRGANGLTQGEETTALGARLVAAAAKS